MKKSVFSISASMPVIVFLVSVVSGNSLGGKKYLDMVQTPSLFLATTVTQDKSFNLLKLKFLISRMRITMLISRMTVRIRSGRV